jgi:hypothetical protein
VSRGHLVAGVTITAAAEAGMQFGVRAPIWTSVVLAVGCLLTAVYVSTVRLAVGSGRIAIGLGPAARRSRLLATSDVATAHAANLSLAQVLGLGVAWHRRTTRLTVRPGPTLVLRLLDGEVIRVSTPDPDLAVQLIKGRTSHE